MKRTDTVADVAAAWANAYTTHDVESAVAQLAPSVTAISPLTEAFRFSGRAQVESMLRAQFDVIQDAAVHTTIVGTAVISMYFRAACAGVAFEENQLLRTGEDGLITELTLFGRPLPGLVQVMSRIGPELCRRQNRRVLGMAVAATSLPLAGMVKSGDRLLVPLAAPDRARIKA